MVVAVRARTHNLALESADHVLEVAVGGGHLAAQILPLISEGWYDGVDLTPEMLERAKQRLARTSCTNYRLLQGDARALPFKAASYDVLFNTYMLELVPLTEVPQIFAEFSRVLKPGGRCVVLTCAGGFDSLWQWAYRHWPYIVGVRRGAELTKPLQQAGFNIESRSMVKYRGLLSQLLVAVKTESK